jgi:RNA-directed DNA polymerase
MRRAGHLFEQVASFSALCAAARRAARGRRLTAVAARFVMDLESECLQLERELLSGEYRPSPYRTFTIADPKPRVISAAAFRDRVVHHAMCAAMEPVFERTAIADSYACRRGKGLHAALTRIESLARKHPRFLRLDVEHFFETASHDVLEALLARRFKDSRLLDLCGRFIRAGAPGSPPGVGLPIGNLTSQHFANFYLAPLDRFVVQHLRAPGYVRYMDDIHIFGDSAEGVRAWHQEIDCFVEAALRLRLKTSATRCGPVTVGIPALGFRIWPRLRRLDAARVRRFRRKVRALWQDPSPATAARIDSAFAFAAVAHTTQLRRSLLARLSRDVADA